jgi:peptidoglycan/LPS O-acetylase OafA/YrhL
MYHMIALNFIVFISLKINITHILGNIGTIVFINVATISLTILTSHLSYFYFEKAFIKLKRKYRETKSDPKNILPINLHTHIN